MENKKIVFICGASETIINFRKNLILFLKNTNNDVYLIVGDEKRKKEIESLGVNYFCVDFSNRSFSILSKIKYQKKLKNIIKKIKPDIVFTFQLTPNIFGVLASKQAHIENIYSMVEGLGDPFQPKSFKDKIVEMVVCKMYKNSFKHIRMAFFLNSDDKEEFLRRKIISSQKTFLINGIGINTENIKADFSLPIQKKVVCLSRLLINKGVFDYCEMARFVKTIRNDIIFELYGEEGQIKIDDLREYIDDGSVFYGGYTTNPYDIIKKARIISSSSFREGFPVVILEAMAIGRPVIASDVIGNKDAVYNDVTGYLVPCHDIKSHGKKIIELIDDDEKIISFGKTARKICEEKYNSNIINKTIVDVIDSAYER